MRRLLRAPAARRATTPCGSPGWKPRTCWFGCGPKGRWTEALRQRLRACVERYQLDEIPGDGRRDLLRRSYTCPFLRTAPLGCGVDPDHKPYGCLAFNPRRPDQAEGGDCASDVDLLVKLGTGDEEKAPIPVMLLLVAQRTRPSTS